MTNHFFEIQRAVEESIHAKQLILSDKPLLDRLEEAIVRCVDSLRSGGKIWFAGNGGSAADAQHLAAELSGRFYLDRKPLPAEALHVNSSFLTAAANDYGYDQVFARLLRGTGHKGDVLVGISTSGNSKNILQAYEVCREKGIMIISLTGSTGGKMKDMSDLLLNVPSTDTPRIQECHIMIGHIICELVETALFGEYKPKA